MLLPLGLCSRNCYQLLIEFWVLLPLTDSIPGVVVALLIVVQVLLQVLLPLTDCVPGVVTALLTVFLVLLLLY